jgi:hypothetical protein
MVAISPLWLRIAGSTLGSYGMFTAPVAYRLELSAESRAGETLRIPIQTLAPHLGHDARRVILPASAGFVGETQVTLMAEGLGDIGRLACKLEPSARAIVVRLERTKLHGLPLAPVSSRVSCEKAR